MPFPTNTETSTTLASYIPAVWGDKINEFYKLKLMLADFFTDRSDELADGGNTLYTPTTTEMTANAKANATAVTLNSPTDTKVTLTVNQWFEVSFAIEDREAAQLKRSYYLQERYAQSAGYTLAKKLEVAIASLFAGFSNVVGTSLTAITDATIRSAIGILEGNGIDTSTDVAFFLSSGVFWSQVQGIDKFSLAINSPSNDPTAKRPQYLLYGIPVYVSNNIQYVSGSTGRNNALAHRDAIHFATSPLGEGGSMAGDGGQMMTGEYGIRVQSHYIPEYLSTLTTSDILYGVIENRDEAGVLILSQA
jgi:hypothetical protein